MKTCSKCRQEKPRSEFYKDRARPDGLYTSCKSCHYERTSTWRRENRELVRERERERYYAEGHRERKRVEKRLRKYGLTQEAYESLLDSQGGVCAICQLPFVDPNESPKDWDVPSVDHCHETGRVRGILHRRCNLALELGLTAEDWRRAESYLAVGVVA